MIEKIKRALPVKRSRVFIAGLVLAVLVLIVASLVLAGSKITRRSPLPPVDNFANYQEQLDWGRYVNDKYNVVLAYPLSWSVNTTTAIFEGGDLIAVEFIGSTQKDQTEFYDGARLVVMIPEETKLDLAAWVANKHQGMPGETPPQVTDVRINGRAFKKVDECGLGCFSYYYTVVDGKVYGIMLSAAGPQKAELEVIFEQMLEKLELGK